MIAAVMESPRAFPDTRWSVVVSAKADSASALEHLCRVYWPAVHAFSRRCGDSEHDAQDLTQSFFAELLAKRWLDGVAAEKGRFRSWLLAAFTNFSRSQWRSAQREKRGGRCEIFSLDDEPFGRAALEVGHEGLTPDAAFERQWVESLVRAAIERLAGEFAAAEKGALFAVMKPFLTEARGATPYAATAAAAGLTEAALKTGVHRMRQRYGEIFREEVAQTVARPEEVDAEIRYLLGVMGA